MDSTPMIIICTLSKMIVVTLNFLKFNIFYQFVNLKYNSAKSKAIILVAILIVFDNLVEKPISLEKNVLRECG